MHLFHDSTLNTWRLITEKLPEKPDPKDYTVDHTVPNNKYHRARMEYDAALAALKQNALTVRRKRRIFVEAGGNYIHTETITVAILTLPEEKKNTMENLTKEQAKEIVAKKHGLGTTLVTGHKASYWEEAMDLFASSGSVAAPKERSQHEDELQSEWERGYKIGKHESDNDHEAIKEFIEEVYNSLYVGPDLEDKEIMQHYIDVFKIIKERAKAILDKQ